MTTKKRINLSVDHEFNTKLERLAAYENRPKTTILYEFILKLEPVIDHLIEGHFLIEQGKSPVKVLDSIINEGEDQYALFMDEAKAATKQAKKGAR